MYLQRFAVWTEVESMSKERYNATSVVHARILYGSLTYFNQSTWTMFFPKN